MNNLLLSLKSSPKYFAYPFILIASFLLVVNFINLFPIEAFRVVYSHVQNSIELLFGIMAVYFVCFYTDNSKKAIASALCYALGDSVFLALSGEHFSLLFAVVFAFIASGIIKNMDLLYSYILLMLVSVIFGLLLGVSYGNLFSALRGFCSFMENKKILFGVVSNVWSVAFSDNFAELFFTKDYSLALLVNDSLVSGIRNIFLADVANPPREVAVLMSGKYVVNLFVTLGAFVAFYSHFGRNELSAFSLVVLLSLAFGDSKLLSLFLLLFNPVVYLGFLAMTFVSYLICTLLDIRIGYEFNGSVVELFRYGEKWVYFIIAGFVIAVMSYFLFQVIISKFDIQKQKILPSEVRAIVNALGGERNIEKITEGAIIVKNPNLINILKLDCDINQNEVTLHYGELELLKRYY